MEYNVLTAHLSVRTLELLFKKELTFISENVELFLDQNPQVIMPINSDSVIVSMILAVKRMMDKVRVEEEASRKQAEENAAWEKEMAEKKAKQANALPDPRALTQASHRQGY